MGATTRFDGNASKGRDTFQRSLPRGFAVYARHRLDVSFRDFLYGLLACLWVSDREELAVEALRACSAEGGIPSLSVRSGFGLLLETLALPEGSEVLVSAITHPDMVRLIGGRCLVPVRRRAPPPNQFPPQ